MTKRIEFFGGPKDGESYYSIIEPTPEFICMDVYETEIDPAHFYSKVAEFPGRTQKYHKYTLDWVNDKYVYKYNGVM